MSKSISYFFNVEKSAFKIRNALYIYFIKNKILVNIIYIIIKFVSFYNIAMFSTIIISNCINYSLLFLNKNPVLLDYVKNFNSKHNIDRTGFIYNNSAEMKIIRKQLSDKGYSGYTIPISLQECEKMLNSNKS